MDKDKQRIAVAKADGWKNIRMSGRWEFSDDPANPQDWCGEHTSGFIGHLPDYPNDLNAMHEAEKVLAQDQMTTMSQYLHRKLGMLWGFATAAQRAEAFLRTLNLWEE